MAERDEDDEEEEKRQDLDSLAEALRQKELELRNFQGVLQRRFAELNEMARRQHQQQPHQEGEGLYMEE